MLSYAFFYFVGQNVAWLVSTWYISLLVLAIIPLIVVIADSTYVWHACTVFIGWAPVAFVPEYVLKIAHATFNGHVTSQMLPIVVTCECLIFVAVTILINANDSSPVFWMILLGVHVGYVWTIWYMNNYTKQIVSPVHARSYYFTYMLVLIVNDVYFLIISLIVHGHALNFMSVFIAAILTGVPLLFANHSALQDFIHKTVEQE